MSIVSALESSSCEIPTEFLVEETFTGAAEFETTAVIRWLHEKTPRFGHSRDLSAALMMAMDAEQEERNDYEKGLIATSYVMICVFILWSVLLIAFKMMGPAKVGILSGSSPVVANTPPRRKTLFRGVFLFAGLSVIISSILMALNGVDSLTNSLDSSREALGIVQNLIQQGVELVDTVIQQNNDTGVEVKYFLETFNETCPNYQASALLCDDNSTNAEDCELGRLIGFENLDIVRTVLDHFEDGQYSLYHQEMVQLRDNLSNLASATEMVDDKAENFNWALYWAMGFSVALSVFCFFMIVGELFRLSALLQGLRSRFVMPVFVLFVFCSLLFSSLFIIWSMALADFCVDSPDDRMLVILDRFREDLSPILVESASFYISHCPADQVPSELASIIQTVVDIVPFVEQFRSMLFFNEVFVQDICGFDDPMSLTALSTTVNSQLCSISEILNNVRLYFQCEKWYPLYETSVYDAMCYNGSSGFAWVASTQFIIVVMSMILLTIRGILYDDDVLIQSDAAAAAEKDDKSLDSGRQSDSSEATKDTIIPSSNENAIEVCPASSGQAQCY